MDLGGALNSLSYLSERKAEGDVRHTSRLCEDAGAASQGRPGTAVRQKARKRAVP